MQFKLSIITINYNNAAGLQKTMESVQNQTSLDFEYIVVDGASTDRSVEIIQTFKWQRDEHPAFAGLSNVQTLNYISEPDNGIYHAMNKGIRMAKGNYVQFLNSGDVLAAPNVTERMLFGLLDDCKIVYGNMLKHIKNGVFRDRGFAGRIPTMLDFSIGSLNHSPSYIKRSLFDEFGMYDESLKIVSDWSWFLEVVGLNGVEAIYKDIDVTIFDMGGISSINSELEKKERNQVLHDKLPLSIIRDYELYTRTIEQQNRIKKFLLTNFCYYLIERLSFVFEKYRIKRSLFR